MIKPVHYLSIVFTVGCASMVMLFIKPETSTSIIAFLTFLGLMISFIDRHNRHQETVNKVTQAANGLNRELIKNTEVSEEAAKGTKCIETAINGRMSEMLETAKNAARAEGILEGQNMISDLIAKKMSEAFNNGYKAGGEARDR